MLCAQADAFLAAMHPIAAMSMNVTPQCSRFFSSYGDFTFHFFDVLFDDVWVDQWDDDDDFIAIFLGTFFGFFFCMIVMNWTDV